jgi:hypothetical protein
VHAIVASAIIASAIISSTTSSSAIIAFCFSFNRGKNCGSLSPNKERVSLRRKVLRENILVDVPDTQHFVKGNSASIL